MQITPCDLDLSGFYIFPHLGHLFSHYCVLTSLPHSPTRGKETNGGGGGGGGGDNGGMGIVMVVVVVVYTDIIE